MERNEELMSKNEELSNENRKYRLRLMSDGYEKCEKCEDFIHHVNLKVCNFCHKKICESCRMSCLKCGIFCVVTIIPNLAIFVVDVE